jgi:hypothetical protein
MPYPLEHAARVRNPDEFLKGKDDWGSKDLTDGIRIIIGRLKTTGKWVTQTYRFDAKKFTIDEAKKLLKDHKVTYISFEPAKS